MKTMIGFTLAAALFAPLAQAAPEDLLTEYTRQGAGPFDAEAGRRGWAQIHPPRNGGERRSCASCHGEDLKRPGRHAKTGKPIEPLAVSVKPARLADARNVEKGLRRNCRWTLGRACTAQEKGDFVSYIRSQ